jgi:hypothetical protein
VAVEAGRVEGRPAVRKLEWRERWLDRDGQWELVR